MRSAIHTCLKIVLLTLLGVSIGDTNPLNIENGTIETGDGIHLYYSKVGNGRETVIIPGRLFLFRDFRRLANSRRTLIFYDMRNRGQSDAVSDPAKISIQDDVKDLEAVRRHFGADKPDIVGFSYLGMMVVYYATQHQEHVRRIVQIGPVSRKFDTEFPKSLLASDLDKVPDPAEEKKLTEQLTNGFATQHPKEYCELEWKIEQIRMVGDPVNADRIPSPCSMPNEWPTHLVSHFQAHFGSIQKLDISKEDIARISVPVLTLHGTQDRNAPYGGGREWAMLLPNARLITIPGAAHMSWVEFPDVVFPAVDAFLNGKWPNNSEKVMRPEALLWKDNYSNQ